MKYIPIILATFFISSCSGKECYECKDGNAQIELSDQFPSAMDISIPNFAIEGLETIRLVGLSRLDGISIAISDASLILKGENPSSYLKVIPLRLFYMNHP